MRFVLALKMVFVSKMVIQASEYAQQHDNTERKRCLSMKVFKSSNSAFPSVAMHVTHSE